MLKCLRSDLRTSDLRKFPEGAWPQSPLDVACLHTQQLFYPPTFKCLAPPLR